MTRGARGFALCGVMLAAGACALVGTRGTAPAPDPYQAIDAYALGAPPEVRASVPSLARYLTASARSDREKARALYRWITANIGHVEEGGVLDAQEHSDAQAVLQRGTAVCAGYSDLFAALAQAAGLEAASIRGFAKGVGYRAGERVGSRTNHAWNAVQIDGTWQLVDCTWGAGTIEDGVYAKRFTPFYFLTPPRAFGWTHYPSEARWQLVDPPLTLAEFEDLPLVREPFFDYGLTLANYRSATIAAKTAAAEIRVEAPPGTVIGARASCGAGEPRDLPVRRRGARSEIAWDPPQVSDCYVRVFAARERERVRGTLEMHWAVEYRLASR